MLSKPQDKQQISLFFSLESTLDSRHGLFILSHKIDWAMFEKEFSPLYCPDNGRPAKPIRLMVGLLMLKHIRNLSDESVVEQWSENAYYQYFCGQQEFLCKLPCEASELVHFRHRIGEPGVELILKESIRINGDDSQEKDIYIDTTVQEKNITFPTDDKLEKNHQEVSKNSKRAGFDIKANLHTHDKETLLRPAFSTSSQEQGKSPKSRQESKNACRQASSGCGKKTASQRTGLHRSAQYVQKSIGTKEER